VATTSGLARRDAAIIGACVAGTLAFFAYTRTLLRGVDLGDTGGFQAAIASTEISARQAYPLYYALARPFVHLTAPANPALGLNLFSAAAGGLAIVLLALVATLVTESIAGGVTAALLLAFSYTWWHQAIIAEVYTLHLMLVGLCLLALYWYSLRPGRARLALFFAIYAGAFGNHLSMILLLLPFAIFLLSVTRPSTRLVRPPIIALALGIAVCGALQYVPELIALRNSSGSPVGIWDTARAFWFDVTKSDWRDAMVLGVGDHQLRDHLSMAIFDAWQQFGYVGLALAIVGLIRLWARHPAWGALLSLGYLINTAFATTYNVGDPHVFFLPGHYMTAFCAGAALMPLRSRDQPSRAVLTAATVAAAAYVAFCGYDTWPAADRHDDHRAEEFVYGLTTDLDEHEAVFVSEMDWQMENALRYLSRVDRRGVAWVGLNDVFPYFPLFVDANHASHRDIVTTAQGAAKIEASFGPLFALAPEGSPSSLDDIADQIPRGSAYVLTSLAPTRDQPPIGHQIDGLLAALTGRQVTALRGGVYEVLAGVAGQAPSVSHSSNRPFRARARLANSTIDVRMDSWLPTETFRRGGFGHVIQDHRHVMALERGVNLVWFDGRGQPSHSIYASGLYAPHPRFRIPANAPRLARAR
jgi:hypothetical protein